MVQELSSSSRRLPKATYAPIQFDQRAAAALSRGFEKASLLRGMQLQAGEVAAVRNSMGSASTEIPDDVWASLAAFEPKPVGVLMPGAETAAPLQVAHLQAFGNALVAFRSANLTTALESPAPSPPTSSAPPVVGRPPTTAPADPAVTGVSLPISAVAERAVRVEPPQAAAAIVDARSAEVARQASLVTFAKASMNNFMQTIQIAPVGRLHLERIEMTPAGVERGELLATVPLAPQETASVMQKEWAVTNDEFSSIVTDYLEQVSEKGVTEKSELAQSSDSQTKHDNEVNLSASVSGSYGLVSFAANASTKLADSISDSEKVSRNHAIETTRKAATRSRKERKVTITTTSVRGTEEVTTRTLTNPSPTDALRVDYFSMMRKWRVRLYRYGLRMTYDIAIPEPGAALREPLLELANLNAQINNSFVFKLDPSTIDPSKYSALEHDWNVALDPPPDPTWNGFFKCEPLSKSGDSQGAQAQSLDFAVPDGFEISDVTVGGTVSPSDDGLIVAVFFGTSEAHIMKSAHIGKVAETGTLHDLTGSPDEGDDGVIGNAATEIHFPSLVGLSGGVSIPFITSFAGSGLLYAKVTATPSAASIVAWQQKVWQTIQQSQSDAFYLGQQSLVQQRDALQAQIAGVDTLTLRQEELTEVMKGFLHWLLGPAFTFMPQDVIDLFGKGTGVSFTSNELGIDPVAGWSDMFIYQEMVKFLQQAIEWENLLYFLYPYFWDVPTSWDSVRSLEHPDLTRQSFVRAGSARVVVTIRPGFEDAFSAFIEQGDFGSVLPPNHPYLSIAQEIQAYNDTNYPGIPPANPDAVPVNSQDAAVTASTSSVTASAGPVTLTVDSTDGFQVGMTVTIDTYDSDAQEAETITAIPDNTHIEVAQLKNTHDGTSTPFPIVQPGEAGVVIAEWYEYTPSHGTDIALATPFPEMS